MVKKAVTYYQVPDKYWHRIHFVRPRFKSNIENVLLYMANECCRIPKCSCEEYSQRYFNAIKMFPGNIDMANKTLHNWRTEIPALFGFYKEDKDADTTETSKMAIFLHENQDLTQFLRLFLLSFQFPGGHMKPQDLKEILRYNIRFKPARTIVQVLMAGNRLLEAMGVSKEMSVSAEEATYCIFNDIRVTSGKVSSEEVAKIILNNRKDKVRYYNKKDPKILSLTGQARSKGDITRYAGDILDYMELANLLEKHSGYYSMKGNELMSLDVFANDKSWFSGYDKLYKKKNIETIELSKLESLWFDYVNSSMKPDLFKTDLRSVIGQNEEIDIVFEDRIRDVVASDNRTTKDIGNLGEAIICSHEKMRLKINGYDEFVKRVQIVDSSAYHPGFDIDSFEADGTENHRYIEVKTTISKQRIQMYGFHMSPNEWRVAETIKEHYCVYRLMLSEKEKILFVLRNPVALYKSDKIEAEPRNGMEITFSTEHFKSTQLLSWKK
jgi:hypothetical protein CLOST_0309